MSDRTVHAITSDGGEIVRYDRAETTTGCPLRARIQELADNQQTWIDAGRSGQAISRDAVRDTLRRALSEHPCRAETAATTTATVEDAAQVMYEAQPDPRQDPWATSAHPDRPTSTEPVGDHRRLRNLAESHAHEADRLAHTPAGITHALLAHFWQDQARTEQP